MAFGDALRRDDGATVTLRAETAQFNADVEAAERKWRESTGAMTREALKLDLAQDRLRTSLAKYGAESAQAKRATIALKDAEEQAARAADKQTRETRELAAAQRTATSGAAAMRNRIVALAAAYVGVHGLVTVIRSSVAAAKEEEVVRGQTRVALEALNISYDAHAGKIERVIRQTQQLGFDDERLLQSFQLLIGGAGDVDTALERVALATGVARGRYIDLEAATQIVNKAQLGMSGALRRIGIDVDKNASSVELLAALTRRYGNSAVAAMDTAQAATDRAGVSWENLKEIMGGALLPQITEYSNRLSDWLSKAENQEEVQRRVNEAVETGEDVVRGLASALRVVRSVVGPVVEAMGGLERAVELALIVGIVSKARRAAASFGLIAASSAATTTKVVRDAAIAGRALDAAYRPRTVTVVGGGAGRFAPIAGAGGLILTGAAVLAYLGIRSGQAEAISGSEMEKLRVAARQGRLTWEAIDDASQFLTAAQERELRGLVAQAQAAYPGPRRPDDRAGARGPGAIAETNREIAEREARDTRRSRRRTEGDVELDLARAGTTASTADDERYLRELGAMYRRQIARLEARERLTKEQRDKLKDLYGRLSGVQSQLEAIEAEEERRAEDARERAAQRRRDAAERRQRQAERRRREEERRMDEFERRTRDADLARARRIGARTGGAAGGFGGGLGAALMGGASRGRRDRSREAQRDGLTEADFRRLSFDFLSSLHGAVGQFGGNIGGTGTLETHAHAQTSLIREQNAILAYLAGSIHSPATRYAGHELSAAGYGVGF